jgi:hypothetical protein
MVSKRQYPMLWQAWEKPDVTGSWSGAAEIPADPCYAVDHGCVPHAPRRNHTGRRHPAMQLKVEKRLRVRLGKLLHFILVNLEYHMPWSILLA